MGLFYEAKIKKMLFAFSVQKKSDMLVTELNYANASKKFVVALLQFSTPP